MVNSRLDKFEKLYLDIQNQQPEISKQLEALRAENKTKTTKFRELMAVKLRNTDIISLFKSYGL